MSPEKQARPRPLPARPPPRSDSDDARLAVRSAHRPGVIEFQDAAKPEADDRDELDDRGHDHDKYRKQVRNEGITPVIARRGTGHGSGLGVHRWVIEQSIALLHWFRRLRIRWEIRDDIHEAFLSLACAHHLLARPDQPLIVLGALIGHASHPGVPDHARASGDRAHSRSLTGYPVAV